MLSKLKQKSKSTSTHIKLLSKRQSMLKKNSKIKNFNDELLKLLTSYKEYFVLKKNSKQTKHLFYHQSILLYLILDS